MTRRGGTGNVHCRAFRNIGIVPVYFALRRRRHLTFQDVSLDGRGALGGCD
jgi:hypothetical protein